MKNKTMVFVSVLFLLGCPKKEQVDSGRTDQKLKSEANPDTDLRGFVNRYHSDHEKNGEQWLITQVGEKESVERVFRHFGKKLDHVNSSFAKKPWAAGPLSHYRREKFFVWKYGRGPISPTPVGDYYLGIVLVPQDSAKKDPRLMKTSFAFGEGKGDQLGQLYVSALNWPNPILAARFIHELSHAAEYKARSEKGQREQTPYELMAEETRANHLEILVLDDYCGGKYIPFLDEIISRIPNQSGFMQWYPKVFSLLTYRDFQEFDRLLNIQDCGITVAETSIAEFLLTLGLRTADQANAGEKERVEFYKWFNSSKSSK